MPSTLAPAQLGFYINKITGIEAIPSFETATQFDLTFGRVNVLRRIHLIIERLAVLTETLTLISGVIETTGTHISGCPIILSK